MIIRTTILSILVGALGTAGCDKSESSGNLPPSTQPSPSVERHPVTAKENADNLRVLGQGIVMPATQPSNQAAKP